MRASRPLLLVVFLAVVVGNGALALAPRQGGPAGELPHATGQQQGIEGTAEGPGQEDAGQDPQPEIDPSTLPPIDISTTTEQEAALRLVEQILAEQQLLLSGQNFVYQADGRRDPFRSLLAVRQREIVAPELRPAGLGGFLINEITVAATANYQGRWQAMIVGFDRRAYFIEVGAVLYDGRVVEISGDEVIFEQDVEDLLGARSTRRVSKRLVTGNQEY